MSLLTFPLGYDQISVIRKIGEYIEKRVPENWLS